MNLFRFTLTHQDSSPEYSQVISEPIGWREMSIVLERSPDYWSLIEHFETPLQFYGDNGEFDGGKDFILEIEEIGIDEIITILIEIPTNDGITYEEVFTGTLDLSTLNEIDDRRIECAILQTDFWSKFINRQETPVDIQSTTDLDGNEVEPTDPVTINLLSQIINQESVYSGHSGDFDTIREVILATDSDITLSGLQTIQGTSLIAGRRVLVNGQTDQTENGPYDVSSGSWTRCTDANTDDELENGIVYVRSGTYAGLTFKQTTTPVTLGVSNIVFVEYNYVDDYLLYELLLGSICDEDMFDFYISATTDLTRNEILESYTIPVFGVATSDEVFNQIELAQGNGTMTISGTIDLSYTIDSDTGIFVVDLLSRDDTFEWYYQINEDTPVLIDSYSINRTDPISTDPFQVTLDGDVSFTVAQGDRVKTYLRINVVSNFDGCTGIWTYRRFYGGIASETVTFSFESQFEDTQAEGFFIHDVGAEILKRIIDASNRFYSEYLGSSLTKARQYVSDGCGWNYIAIKGLQLRGYTLTEKKFFQSFKQWWNGVNPIFNLAVGYERIEGEDVISVTSKAEQFDETISVYLDYVNNIERKYDKEHLTKKLTIGYSKWESEDIRGIDDPQTKKTYATRLQTVGSEKTVTSEYIAASLAIESTRRKTAERTTDYKFDNDTFIIAINPEPSTESPETYDPELDENFDSVTDLTNSDNRYNLFLTPFRNFMRWANFFLGCVQSYQSSYFKFTSGEGNYNFSSDYDCTNGIKSDCQDAICGDIAENDDLQVSGLTNQVGYLFSPVILEFKHPLSWEDYKTIRDNKKKAIGVSTTAEGHDICFIKSLKYDINLSTGTFVVWKR
jgi:hypothetical protein